MGASFVIIAFYSQAKYWWQRTLLIVTSATALLLAMMTKETTIVLIPISLGWVMIGWLRIDGKSSPNLPTRWAYLVASLIPVGIFFGVRAYFVSVSLDEGSNTGSL